MAKKAHPWFWEARGSWYVTLGGKQHLLEPYPEKAPTPEKSKKTQMITGAPAEAAKELVRRLREEARAI